MSRFLINTHTSLNDVGRIGATAFVGGAIGSPLAWWWWVNTPTNPFDTGVALPLVVMFASVFVAALGIVGLVAGRDYKHQVTVLPDK